MTCCITDTVTLKTHRSGDTWRGLSIALKRNGVPIDLTGARIDMQMRKSVAATQALFAWSTAALHPHTAPTIEVSSPTNGIISVLPRVITVVHDLVFDIQLTEANGVITTVVTGTLPVVLDVTRVT